MLGTWILPWMRRNKGCQKKEVEIQTVHKKIPFELFNRGIEVSKKTRDLQNYLR